MCVGERAVLVLKKLPCPTLSSFFTYTSSHTLCWLASAHSADEETEVQGRKRIAEGHRAGRWRECDSTDTYLCPSYLDEGTGSSLGGFSVTETSPVFGTLSTCANARDSSPAKVTQAL